MAESILRKRAKLSTRPETDKKVSQSRMDKINHPKRTLQNKEDNDVYEQETGTSVMRKRNKSQY